MSRDITRRENFALWHESENAKPNGKNDTRMNIKKALLTTLEEKQIRLFEQKQRGDRKTDRYYVQIISTVDELKRKKTHDTTRRKNRRQTYPA